MSTRERDFSSDDWRYCMSKLEESFGRISTVQLEKDLLARTKKKQNRSGNYVKNTVARALSKYRQDNPFWQAGM